MSCKNGCTKCKMRKYEALLVNLDWYYDMSDDNRVYKAGSEAYTEAVRLRDEVDPEWMVWNEYAPEELRK